MLRQENHKKNPRKRHSNFSQDSRRQGDSHNLWHLLGTKLGAERLKAKGFRLFSVILIYVDGYV